MFRFEVPQELINAATANSSSHCMVADSLKQKYPDALHVNVDIQTIRFTRRGKRYVFATPPAVVDQIIAFDAGDRAKIKPFTVKLQNGSVYPLMHVEGGMPNKERIKVHAKPQLEARLLRAIQDNPGVTRRELREKIGGGSRSGGGLLDEALDSLEDEGFTRRARVKVGGDESQRFYPLPQNQRIVVGNIRNSRFRRFGLRALRVNQ